MKKKVLSVVSVLGALLCAAWTSAAAPTIFAILAFSITPSVGRWFTVFIQTGIIVSGNFAIGNNTEFFRWL